MVPRRVIAFLLSVVPIFFGLLWLWQSRGLDTYYHRALAGMLDALYPHVAPPGLIRGVGYDSHEFVFHLLVNGRGTALYVNAQDITWNLAMVLSLYAASATNRRRYWWCFAASLAIMAVVHAVTVGTFAREGLLSNPKIAPLLPHSTFGEWLVAHYNRFYEELGVHLLVLALWLPYAMSFIRSERGQRAEATPAIREPRQSRS